MKASFRRAAQRLVMAGCLPLSSSGAWADYVIPVRGMSAIGVSPPLSPTNVQQCQRFIEAAAEVGKRLNGWHDQCLAARRGTPPDTGRPGVQCTYVACNDLHLSRDRFASGSAAEAKSCFDQVSVARAGLYKMFATADTLAAAQSALLSGPTSELMKKLKKDIAESFSGLIADSAKAGMDNAELAAKIWSKTDNARARCLKQVPSLRATDCEKQVLLSVQSESLFAIGKAGFDPAVSTYLKGTFEVFNMQSRESLRLLEGLKGMDEPNEDDGGTIGR